jgi:hypothetical protein
MLFRSRLCGALATVSIGLFMSIVGAQAQSKDSTFWSSPRAATSVDDSAKSPEPIKSPEQSPTAGAATAIPAPFAASTPKELQMAPVKGMMQVGRPMQIDSPSGVGHSTALPLGSAPAIGSAAPLSMPFSTVPSVPGTPSGPSIK